MSEKKETTKPAPKGGTKPRSPNYPAVGLEEAVKRVKKLLDADGRAGAPVEAAAQHIGFSGAHGSALVVLSALKKFGLVEDTGGRLVPTQLAVDITTFPVGHVRRTQALQTAVLKPTAYKIIVDQFKGVGQLPSDASLQPELIADRGYTASKVAGFLKDLRASLIYAGLLEGNKLLLSGESGSSPPSDSLFEDADGVEAEDDENVKSMMQEQKNNPTPPRLPLPGFFQTPAIVPAAGSRDLPITLPSLELAVLRVPVPMTEEDFEALVNALKAMKKKLVATTPSAADTQNQIRMQNAGSTSGQ